MDAVQITIMPALPTNPGMASMAALSEELTNAESTIGTFDSLITKAILEFDTKEIIGDIKLTDGVKSEQLFPENPEQTTDTSLNQFSLLQLQLSAAQTILPTLQQAEQHLGNCNNEEHKTLDIRTITSVSEANYDLNKTVPTENQSTEVASRTDQTQNTVTSNTVPLGTKAITDITSTKENKSSELPVNNTVADIKTATVENKSSGLPVNNTLANTKTAPVENKSSGLPVNNTVADIKTATVENKSSGLPVNNTLANTKTAPVENKSSGLPVNNTVADIKTATVENKSSGLPVNNTLANTKTAPVENKSSGKELLAKNHTDINLISESASQKLSSVSTDIKTELSVTTNGQIMISDDKPLMPVATENNRASSQTPQIGIETPLVKVAVSAPTELQKAVEMQSLSNETPTITKSNSTSILNQQSSNPFADITMSSSDTPDNGESSSDSEHQQGTQKLIKTSTANPAVTENIASASNAETSLIIDQNDHQIVNHQLRGNLNSMPIDEFSAEAPKAIVPEQIGRQVLERLNSHEIKQGNDQISFKLSPENLGNLQLTMRMEDQRLKLEIVAENREVRNALLTQADDLKESLAKQNIKVDSFDVTTSNGGNLSQQSRNWKNGTTEYQPYQPQYASRLANTTGTIETPLRYFATQYQSTIDVRF